MKLILDEADLIPLALDLIDLIGTILFGAELNLSLCFMEIPNPGVPISGLILGYKFKGSILITPILLMHI